MLTRMLRDALQAGASHTRPPSAALMEDVWPTLVGDPLCHRTRPRALRERTLVVAVASDAWQKELNRQRRQLLARIHRVFPWPVDAIEFVVEVMDPPPQAATSHPAEKIPTPAIDALDAPTRTALDALDDPTRALLLKIRGHMERDRSALNRP